MNALVVALSTAEGDGRWAGGLVVTDVSAARTVHAAGQLLEEAEGSEQAAYLALLRGLSVIEALEPEDVELQCDAAGLVAQLTGDGPVQPHAEALYEQAMMRLLRLGLWRIRRVEATELSQAAELAEAALAEGGPVVEAQADAAATNGETANGQVGTESAMRWVVAFAEDAGPRCPMDCRAGQRFGFGPETPAGFCVHALAAVVVDGPLAWQDPEQRRMTTTCPRCDVPLDISLV